MDITTHVTPVTSAGLRAQMMRGDISDIVMEEMVDKLPDALRDQTVVVQIFNEACAKMRNDLDAHVVDIVKSIVEDDKYHIVNDVYFNEFKNRGSKQIEAFNRYALKSVKAMKDDINEELELFREEANVVYESNKRVRKLETKINWLIGGIAVLGTTVGYLFWSK